MSIESKAPQGKFRVIKRMIAEDFLIDDYDTCAQAIRVADDHNKRGSNYFIYDDQGDRVPSKIEPRGC